ncbi:MAG: SpoIIE family protein phosphatase [Clostridia bacterium]|nr:SpoIIE family protein phosphatase [Clostridia bacterium]
MLLNILKLIPLSAIPVIVSVLAWKLDNDAVKFRDTLRGKILIGILFGLISVIGSEFGVSINGAIINIRDAAPICAGLIFSAPSGIIAGLIGGAERFFAVAWGAGEYTRAACVMSTILAGLLSAAIRHYIFDNKMPRWMYGMGVALYIETFHMLMIFLTHLSDAVHALPYVRQCALPMILVNTLAVTAAVLLVSTLCRPAEKKKKKLPTILQSFQRGTLIVMAVALAASVLFVQYLETRRAQAGTEISLSRELDDVAGDISERTDQEIMSLAEAVSTVFRSDPVQGMEMMAGMGDGNLLDEINYYGEDGIISGSNLPEMIGKSVDDSPRAEQLKEILAGETTKQAFDYGPSASDPSAGRRFAAAAVRGGGMVEIGMNTDQVRGMTAPIISGLAQLHGVGGGGYVLIADRSGNILSRSDGKKEGTLQTLGFSPEIVGAKPDDLFLSRSEDEKVFGMYRNVEGFTTIAAMPYTEAMFSRDLIVYIIMFLEVIIFGSMFILMYFLAKHNIADNLVGINRSLGKISSGNLNVKVNVRSNSEFSDLSDDINKTVETMKGYIAEESARLERELELAKTIQHSALPNVFPPYPYRHEFDIFAEMVPAKEVGGDFYDFYIVDGSVLLFVIADVSGKGIPASLFMMRSRTMIKSLALSGVSVEEVFRQTNDNLCTENDAEMFVTAWIGGLDLSNGAVTFSNAGHNPPLVRYGGQFEYLEGKSGFVLGGMEDMTYHKQQFKLKKGDAIFLYTDGVTEAVNVENKPYGEERLKDLLNSLPEDCSSEEICKRVKADVYEFAGKAPQFDDITVMCVRFLEKMPRVTMEPSAAR